MNYFDGSTQPKTEKVFKSLWKHYIKSSRVNSTSVYYAKRCHLLSICKKPKMVLDESVHAIFPYEGRVILVVWKFVCLMIQIGCTILLEKVKKEIMMV